MADLFIKTSNNKKYLFLDHGGVLDGSFSEEKPSNDDLLLDQVEGYYQVIKNGVLLVKQLNLLVSSYGYEIVFHSKSKEADQMSLLNSIRVACSNKDLAFPNITAMAVRDAKEFNGVESENPVIIKNRKHGIWIAGYDKELDGKACVRNALSKLLSISEISRKRHYILDDGASVICRANLEGWSSIRIGTEAEDVGLDKAIDMIFQLELLEEPLKQMNLDFGDSLISKDISKF